jgi:cell division transport system ATP-binding protein
MNARHRPSPATPSGALATPMIRMDHVGYRYPASASRVQPWALHGITLELARGSFHLLTGASGAGKTTLFNILTLSLAPTTGDLWIDGTHVDRARRSDRAALRRTLGVVWQDFRLIPHLTVRQNVELPLRLSPTPPADAAHAVAEMLDWVGLTPLADRPAGELSGGEQQRTAIARAVVHRPALLLADEPTGNVDAAMARKILHLFSELHRHGTTIVLATHDTGLIASKQIPVLRLDAGQLVFDEEMQP